MAAYYDHRDKQVSWERRGLVATAWQFKNAYRWQVWSGTETRILEDKLCSILDRLRQHINPTDWGDKTINLLFANESMNWNAISSNAILARVIRPYPEPCNLWSGFGENEDCTVKSGYFWLSTEYKFSCSLFMSSLSKRGRNNQTTHHLFRDCEVTKLMWWASLLGIVIEANPSVK